MNLLDITLHSLRRQKGKKVFLVSAMALSLCTSLVLYSFVHSQERELESQFDEYGANIVVTPHTDDLSLSYGGVSLAGIVTHVEEIQAADVALIRTIPNKQNIRAVSPKLIGTGRVSAGEITKDVLIVGVDFEEEGKIKAWWSLTGRYPETDTEIVAGAKVAATLGLEVGMPLQISGRNLTVSGLLLATGSQDDSALLAPMAMVEEMLRKEGRVSLVEVSALCSDCPIEDLVDQISAVMPGTDVQAVRQVMEQRMQVIRQFGRFALSIFVVLTLMCGLFIFATVTGAVTERKKEIGIMRAVGFSASHIIRVVLSEAAILGSVAGGVGLVLTLPLIRYIVPLLSGTETAGVSVSLLGASFLVLVTLSVVSAIAPAIKASRFDPISAIASL